MKKFLAFIGAVFVVVISVFIFMFSNNDINKETNDIEKYGDWYGLLGHTNLLIFPENIPDNATNAEYYYYNYASSLGPSSTVFLKCDYNEEDYRKEIERLKRIDNIKYSEELYNYKAYISILGSIENEYALLCDDKTIIYIFNLSGIKDSEKIEKKYLEKNNDSELNKNRFSIYQIDNNDEYKYWPESWRK